MEERLIMPNFSILSHIYCLFFNRKLETKKAIHNNRCFEVLVWISNWQEILIRFSVKGAYIKYVGGETGGCYEFFKKYFVAQETIDLNISWSGNFFRKYFMVPPINFSFLFKAYLQQYFRVALSNIQISNHQRS